MAPQGLEIGEKLLRKYENFLLTFVLKNHPCIFYSSREIHVPLPPPFPDEHIKLYESSFATGKCTHTILRTHVGNCRPVRQRELLHARTKELHKFANHTDLSELKKQG